MEHISAYCDRVSVRWQSNVLHQRHKTHDVVVSKRAMLPRLSTDGALVLHLVAMASPGCSHRGSQRNTVTAHHNSKELFRFVEVVGSVFVVKPFESR